MTSLTVALMLILVFFAGFLLLSSVSSWFVCAICASVTTTWITLLVLFQAGFAIDPLVIGILMGGSGVGAMYLLEKKLEENYHLFRLAFLATVIALTYLLIAERIAVESIVVLLLLWLASLGLFLKRDSQSFQKVVSKIIQCCKNW